MNKLQARLQALQNQQDNIEGQIEHVQAKIRRANLKRDRKQYRKKLAKDPTFRATMKILQNIERAMFG
jgi:peptidoglycan hydrolase CwlO-like protein